MIKFKSFLGATFAAVALLTSFSATHAATPLSGGASFFDIGSSGTITFTASTFQISGNLGAFTPSGNLAFVVNSPATFSAGAVTGLSVSQTVESINAFITFGNYSFNLTSISDTLSAGDIQLLGSGVLTDLTNTFGPSIATFSLSSSTVSPSTNFTGNIFASGVAPSVGVPDGCSTVALLGLATAAVGVTRRRFSF